MSWRHEVEKLRRWAATIPTEQRTSEWEFYYPDWGPLYDAVRTFLVSSSAHGWVQGEIDDLLYAIARDNEGEILADEIEEYPDLLLPLSELAIYSREDDAKWQLASRLGNLSSRRHEAELLLLKFVDDAHEYVRRIALLALGSLRSTEAERLAERAWRTGDKYQRAAALSVLEDIGSDKLHAYQRMAEEDARDGTIEGAIDSGRED